MPASFSFFFATLLIFPAAARVFNVTIDDTLGDARTSKQPRYEPKDWNSRSVGGAPCPKCTAQPEGTLASNGTWHDKTTYANDPPSNLTINFDGTEIYVYCILPNGIWNTVNTTRLDFYLDESPTPDRFFHEKNETLPPYLYDQLVFRSARLPAGNHTLLVSNVPSDTGSLILFDYAIYTTEDRGNLQTTPTTSSEAPVGPTSTPLRAGHSSTAVVGGAVSGALLGTTLLILAIAFIVYRRRRVPYASSALDGFLGPPPDARFARLHDRSNDPSRATPNSSTWYPRHPVR